MPYKIGYDVSGTIVAIGPGVASTHPHLKLGAEVYSRVPEDCRGTASEYTLSTADTTALKPRSASHIQAASIPLASLTSLQALDAAGAHFGGDFTNKTVYIPGGLSGTGSTAIQLAKRVFNAGKVITTVSTAKIARLDDLLGKDIVDQVIDYTKEDATRAVAAGSVDFMFDTMGQGLKSLHLMKKGGIIVSVSGIPFGSDLKKAMPEMPVWIRLLLDAVGAVISFRAGRYQVKYRPFFLTPSAEDLERLGGWIDEGRLRPVVGSVVSLDNLDAMRKGCETILAGKGGTGKCVIEVDSTGA